MIKPINVVSKNMLGSRSFAILKHRRPIILSQRARNAELQNDANNKSLEWRHIGATILHRFPTITKDLEKWEIDMENLQDKIDRKKREWLSAQLIGTEAHIFPENDPTYEEILESMPFKPASRITEADEKNDRRSLNRRLQDSLFLIVKRNRGDSAWQFPQGKLLPDETIRTAGERVVDRAVGQVDRWFVGNAPIGHYCYPYPASMQEQRNAYGAKVFYTRAQLITGDVKLQTKLYTDYAWIARDEVGEYFDKEQADFFSNLLAN